jgi:hypothetical protein
MQNIGIYLRKGYENQSWKSEHKKVNSMVIDFKNSYSTYKLDYSLEGISFIS